MRVGLLADAFNLECTPHNWGNPTDLAVHFPVTRGIIRCISKGLSTLWSNVFAGKAIPFALNATIKEPGML